MKNRWQNTGTWMLTVALALALPVMGCSTTPEAVEGGEPEIVVDSDVLPVDDSPILGEPDAPVTVMEFSSMQCPFCGRANVVMHELVERYEGDVRVVFKYYPLPNQPQAEPASRILEATRLQDEDAFWPMKSALFARIQEFGSRPMEDIGAELAEEMGLDGERLRRDFQDPELADNVARDLEMGADVGVGGTPHFFVNGEVVSGAQPIEYFSEVVDEQLELVDELRRQGVAEEDIYREAVERNMGTSSSQL